MSRGNGADFNVKELDLHCYGNPSSQLSMVSERGQTYVFSFLIPNHANPMRNTFCKAEHRYNPLTPRCQKTCAISQIPWLLHLNLEATRTSATTSTLELAALGDNMGFLWVLLVSTPCNVTSQICHSPCACEGRSRSA